MPNDWKTATIEDVATFSQGVQVPVEEQYFEFADNLKRFIRIIDITQPQNPDIRYINDPQRGYVDYSDIFMIRYGTPGIISRNFKGVIANNLFKISSKNNNVTDNYLFQFFNSDNMQNYLTRNAVSSTMPAINFSTLYRQEIIIPSNDIMLKFTKLDETIRKQSLNIKREIQLLLSIRKNVLSKLMLENSDSSTAKLSFSVHFIIYLMQIKSMNFSGNLCYFFCFLMLINNKLSFLVLLTMPLNKSFPKHFKVMFFKSIMMQSHFFNA